MNNIDLIRFGILLRPHGLRGYISIKFFNKHSKLLNKKDKIFFKNDLDNFLTIEAINYNSKNNLVKFFELSNRNEVEKFNNIDFYVDKNILPDLSNNEHYFVDFLDCMLFDQDKNRIGLVKDIAPIENNDILIVDTAYGEKMIPFAKDLIMFFDKDDKKLVMMIHKGIFE